MRQGKYVYSILVILAALVGGCSSYKPSNSNKPKVTGLAKRALLSNLQTGAIVIMDAQKDTLVKTLTSATGPAKMVTAGGITIVLNSGAFQVSVIDNTQELLTDSVPMQGVPTDVAISPDGKTAYAAVRNSGVVEIVNTANGTFAGTVTVPSPSRLVEGPKGHKLLVFADDPQTLGGANANAFFVIDTASNTATTIALPVGSQPFSAVFDPNDANDTTAFILNCAAECGGNNGSPTFTPIAPSVVKVNFGGGSPVFSAAIPVSAATVGLLSGGNLFVAGTPTTPVAGCLLAACGTLQVINTGAGTAGAPIPITDGHHLQMAMTTSNRVYVGASNCTPGTVSAQNQVQGCLSIYNTGVGVSASNPVFPVESSFRQNLNVTGFQPISKRNVIYVCQGGEIDIFDINTDAPSTSITQIDVVGNAIDVVQIDP